jgi:hypothetical protein
MIYVIDSNVAFKWHVQEDGSDLALQVRDEFIKGLHTLLSPDFFPVEIAHSLTAEWHWCSFLGATGRTRPVPSFLRRPCQGETWKSQVRLGIVGGGGNRRVS